MLRAVRGGAQDLTGISEMTSCVFLAQDITVWVGSLWPSSIYGTDAESSKRCAALIPARKWPPNNSLRVGLTEGGRRLSRRGRERVIVTRVGGRRSLRIWRSPMSKLATTAP